MMFAYTDECILPRYLVLPPPTSAAPCLVQTFFAPVEMPAPPPAPTTDARLALCSFFAYANCFMFLITLAVFVWASANGWHTK